MDLGKKRFKTLLENEAGIALVRASYDGESLLGLSFLLPSLESIYLDLSHKETDSLLGEVQAICDEETRAVFAYVGSVDWHKPASIPAVDCPGKLPLGVGSALLNFLASQAHKAHKNSMVYRGPYPTANLFETLMQSFDCDAEMGDCLLAFTSGVEENSLTGVVAEKSLEFIPNPFHWRWPQKDVCVQSRKQIEKVYLNGRSYTSGRFLRQGCRQLHLQGTEMIAALTFANEPVVEMARFTTDGEVVNCNLNSPALAENALNGAPLHPEFLRAVRDLVLEHVPELMKNALGLVWDKVPFQWGDAGDDWARFDGGVIVVHSLLGEALKGLSRESQLNHLLNALDLPTQYLAQSILARSHQKRAEETLIS
ncbi:MAG: hypothetical protein VYA34_16405 [Myxococcota bacterium]|nr:hypothetical protein [Myxococcota bacterium]